nr:MAG TPA: nuclease [Caudoviricetes sp.]
MATKKYNLSELGEIGSFLKSVEEKNKSNSETQESETTSSNTKLHENLGSDLVNFLKDSEKKYGRITKKDYTTALENQRNEIQRAFEARHQQEQERINQSIRDRIGAAAQYQVNAKTTPLIHDAPDQYLHVSKANLPKTFTMSEKEEADKRAARQKSIENAKQNHPVVTDINPVSDWLNYIFESEQNYGRGGIENVAYSGNAFGAGALEVIKNAAKAISGDKEAQNVIKNDAKNTKDKIVAAFEKNRENPYGTPDEQLQEGEHLENLKKVWNKINPISNVAKAASVFNSTPYNKGFAEYKNTNTPEYQKDVIQKEIERTHPVQSAKPQYSPTQITKNLLTNTAYNMPAIAVSVASRGTAVAPYANYISGATLGIQSMSDSYDEAKKEGATDEEAAQYAMLEGVNQGVMDTVLGGVSGATGGLLDKPISNLASHIVRTPLAKTMVETGLDMLEEGMQESAQNYITTINKRVTYNPDAEFDVEGAVYEGVLGGLNSLVLSPGKAYSRYQVNKASYDTVNSLSIAANKVSSEQDAKVISDIANQISKGADEVIADSKTETADKANAEYIKRGAEAVKNILSKSSPNIIKNNRAVSEKTLEIIRLQKSNDIESLTELVKAVKNSGYSEKNKNAVNNTVDYVNELIRDWNKAVKEANKTVKAKDSKISKDQQTAKTQKQKAQGTLELANSMIPQLKSISENLRSQRAEIDARLKIDENIVSNTAANQTAKTETATVSESDTSPNSQPQAPTFESVSDAIINGSEEEAISKMTSYVEEQAKQTSDSSETIADSLMNSLVSKYDELSSSGNAETAAEFTAKSGELFNKISDNIGQIVENARQTASSSVKTEQANETSSKTEAQQTQTTTTERVSNSAYHSETAENIRSTYEGRNIKETAENIIKAHGNVRSAVDYIHDVYAKSGGSNADASTKEYIRALDSEIRKANKPLLEKNIKRVETLLKEYGVKNVEIDESITPLTDDGKSVWGMAHYNRGTGRIYVSPYADGKAIIGSKIVHEFTHHAAKADNSLVSDILKAASESKVFNKEIKLADGTTTTTIDNLMRLVKENYADEINEYIATATNLSRYKVLVGMGKSEADAARIVADEFKASHAEEYNSIVDEYVNEDTAAYVMEFLNQEKNEDVLSQLIKDNRPLWKRILDKIEDFIAKITGKTEAREYQKAADKIREILGNEIDAKVENTGSFKAIQQQIKNGNSKIGNTSDGRKFSMEMNVDESNGLFAIHNLTADSFMKSYELGGFAMPSIAIARSDVGHSNFGDISLVFASDTINPANSDNKVYSADAWTPTFPRIEYEANSKVTDKLRDKYYELYGKFGHEKISALYPYGNYFEEQLNTDGGVDGIISKQSDNPQMMQVYLADTQGKTVDSVVKETKTTLPSEQVEQSEFIIDKLGADTVNEMRPQANESPISARKRWMSEHGDAFKAAYADYLMQSGLTSEEAQNAIDNMTKAQLLSQMVKTRNYLANGAETVKSEVDTEATNNAIKEAVNQEDYLKWLHSLFDGGEKKSGVSNGKEPYTRNGNQRPFSATHYPVTLDNIVLSMKSQGDGNTKNATSIFVGSKTIRAESATEYSSLDEIRADKGRLAHRTPEEAKAAWDEFDNRLSAIINRIMDAESGIDNRFIEQDRIGSVLAEASRNNTEANIKKVLTQYKLTPAVSADFKALVDDIKSAPVDIFEAKPERVVGLDEVKYAIVPSDVNSDVTTALNNAGIETKTYENGNETDRLKVLNTLSDVRFSKQLDKYDYSKSFSEQIEDYKNGIIPKYDTLVVGKTPEVFTKIGLNPLPMTYGTGHLSDILKGNVQDHDFGEANLKQIPKALESPVAIFASSTRPDSSVVAILDLSYNNKPMFAAVEIDGTGKLNGENIDSNAITTLHTRQNAANMLNKALAKESNGDVSVYYLDKNKATRFLRSSGVQFPGVMSITDGYVHSIRDSGSPVNIKIENVTKTQQFKRWFGDWENHPKAASKVVNADGTPKVVYHGTNADFWTFSLANRGKNGEKLGVGYYFVDNKSSAERYGDRVVEAYLDIKKPASAEVMEISRKDWEKFLDFAMEHRDEYIDGEWKGNEINKEYELTNYDYGSNDAALIKGFLNGIAAGNKDVTEAYLEMLKDSTGYDGIAYNTDNTDYYVAFTPEQIKSATDNIGTFDKDNKDIRYSKELMTAEEKKKVREAERAAYLERQLVSTAPLGGKAKAVSPTAKAAVAKKIASGMPGVSTAQVNEQLTKFFEVIEHPKATTPAAYRDEVRQMANITAQNLYNEFRVENTNPLYDEFNDAYNHIKSLKFKMTDAVKDDFGKEAYSDFYKRARGTLKLRVNDGMAVDELWGDLCNLYPYFFNKSTTNPSEMMEQIYEVQSSLKKTPGHPYYDMSSENTDIFSEGEDTATVNSIADALVAAYLENAKPTVAAENKSLRNENKRLAEEANAARGEAADAKTTLKVAMDWNQAELTKMYGDFTRQISEEQKQLQQANRKIERLTNKVERKNVNMAQKTALKEIGRLHEMFTNPTKQKHIPQNLRAAVGSYLASLNNTKLLNGKTVNSQEITETLQSEQERINSAASKVINTLSGKFTTDSELYQGRSTRQIEALKFELDKLTELANESPNSGVDSSNNADYIRAITDLTRMVNYLVKQSNDFFTGTRKVEAETFAKSWIDELSGHKTRIGETGFERSQFKKLLDGVGYSLMSADLFFSTMGEPGKEISSWYRNAQTRQVKMKQEYGEYMSELLGDNYSTIAGSTQAKKNLIDVKIHGNDVKVSKNQLMSLYLTWKRAAGRRHLENGGAAFTNANNETSKVYVIDEATYNTLMEKLTADDKRIADGIGKFLSENCSEWGNEASMQLYGIRLYEDSNYFPIRTPSELRDTNFSNLADTHTIENSSFTHKLNKNANAAVVIGDVFDIADRHVNDMSAYSAYAPLNNSMERAFNANGLKRALSSAYGNNGVKYMQDFIDKINGNEPKRTLAELTDKIPLWVPNNAKKAAVSANISTALKQPLSLVRSWLVIDPKYTIAAYAQITPGVNNIVKQGKEYNRILNTMNEYSGIAVIKSLGYSDTGIGTTTRETYDEQSLKSAYKKTKYIQQSAEDIAMRPAEFADEITWVRMWKACELEAKAKYGNTLSTDEFNRRVADKFNEIIGKTQVVDSVLDTAPISTNRLFKTLYPFMNEPVKTAATLISAAENVRNGKSGAKKQLTNAIGCYVISNLILEPIVSSLVGMWRHDSPKDPEDFAKKFLERFIGIQADGETKWTDIFSSNVADGLFAVPYIAQIYDTIANKFNNFDPERMDLQPVADLVGNGMYFFNSLSKEDYENQKTKANYAADMIASLAQIFGIPGSTLKRDLSAIARTAVDATGAYVAQWELNKVYYNLGNANARTNKNFYDIMAKAYNAGDTEAYSYMLRDLRSIQTGAKAFGVPYSSINKYITEHGAKIVEGTDMWYVSLQAEYDLNTFVPNMKVEKLVTSVYQKAKNEKLDNYENAIYKAPTTKANATFSVNKEDYEMTLEEFDNYIRNTGDFAYKITNALPSNYKWSSLNTAQQLYALEKTYEFSKAYWKKKLKPEYSAKSNWMDELCDNKVDFQTYARVIINQAEKYSPKD